MNQHERIKRNISNSNKQITKTLIAYIIFGSIIVYVAFDYSIILGYSVLGCLILGIILGCWKWIVEYKKAKNYLK
jgi:hypothetical protein